MARDDHEHRTTYSLQTNLVEVDQVSTILSLKGRVSHKQYDPSRPLPDRCLDATQASPRATRGRVSGRGTSRRS